jgi:hypothetical protein
MFSAGLREARPLKVKAGMLSRQDGIRRDRRGLIATRLRARLAIMCQSFVEIPRPRTINISRDQPADGFGSVFRDYGPKRQLVRRSGWVVMEKMG